MIKIQEKQNIPKGWEIKKISDLLDYERPDNYFVKNTNYLDVGTPVLTANKSFILGYTNEDFGIYKNLPVIIFDDFTTDNKYVDFPFKVKSSAIKILKPKNKDINLKFIYEKINSIKFPVGNHKRYYISQYQNLDVAVPQKRKEQDKIAEILGAVDEDIEKTDEIIKKTEELKRGLMQELFTKSIKSKKLKIKEISEVTSSKRVMVSDYVSEGIPFYRSTEIIKKSKNISINNLLYISVDKFNFFKDRFGTPEKGDLLITAVGTIGDVYMVQNETFYFKDGNLVWIRKIKDLVLPEYLRMILGSNFYKEKLNNIAGGSSQKALTIQKLENIEVPVPSITEQKKISDILSSIDNKIEINKKIKNQLAQFKKGLMQDLLSGRVRVNV